MGWFDDIQARVSQAGDQALKDVNTYLIGATTQATVKIAQNSQGGNLTAAQLAAGQFGGALAQAPPASTIQQNQNSLSASQIIPGVNNKNMGLILVAGLAAFFFLNKRSRR